MHCVLCWLWEGRKIKQPHNLLNTAILSLILMIYRSANLFYSDLGIHITKCHPWRVHIAINLFNGHTSGLISISSLHKKREQIFPPSHSPTLDLNKYNTRSAMKLSTYKVSVVTEWNQGRIYVAVSATGESYCLDFALEWNIHCLNILVFCLEAAVERHCPRKVFCWHCFDAFVDVLQSENALQHCWGTYMVS